MLASSPYVQYSRPSALRVDYKVFSLKGNTLYTYCKRNSKSRCSIVLATRARARARARAKGKGKSKGKSKRVGKGKGVVSSTTTTIVARIATLEGYLKAAKGVITKQATLLKQLAIQQQQQGTKQQQQSNTLGSVT